MLFLDVPHINLHFYAVHSNTRWYQHFSISISVSMPFILDKVTNIPSSLLFFSHKGFIILDRSRVVLVGSFAS